MQSILEKPRHNAPRLAGGVALTLWVCATSVGCNLSPAKDDGNLASDTKPLPVNVMELTESTDVYLRHSYYGKLAPQRESSLGFARGGKIQSINGALGAAVGEGDEIATLEMGTLEKDLAQLREAQQGAEQKLAGYQSSPNVNVLRAEMAAIRQQIDQLKSQADELQAEINRGKILAPYNGLIAATFFDEGTTVPAGRPVARIIENAVPQVSINVARAIVDQLLPEQTVQVRLGEATLEANAVLLSPEVNPASQTTRLILQLAEDTDPSLWRFGAVAEVRFWLPSSRSGFWVPQLALQRGAGGLWSVYVARPADDGGAIVVERRSVEVVQLDDSLALIDGSLAAGDSLLIDGLNRVVPGQAVAPTTMAPTFQIPGPPATE